MTAGSRAACACAFCTATGTSISCRLRGPKFWEEARGVGPTTRPWGVRWASGEICVETKRKSHKHPSFFLFFFLKHPPNLTIAFEFLFLSATTNVDSTFQFKDQSLLAHNFNILKKHSTQQGLYRTFDVNSSPPLLMCPISVHFTIQPESSDL